LGIPGLGLGKPGLGFAHGVVDVQSTNIDVVIRDLDCRQESVLEAKVACRRRLGYLFMGNYFLVLFCIAAFKIRLSSLLKVHSTLLPLLAVFHEHAWLHGEFFGLAARGTEISPIVGNILFQ
jgi:hypothetical protein